MMFYIYNSFSPEKLQIQELDWYLINSIDRHLYIYIYKIEKSHQFYNYKKYISKPYRIILYIINNLKDPYMELPKIPSTL